MADGDEGAKDAAQQRLECLSLERLSLEVLSLEVLRDLGMSDQAIGGYLGRFGKRAAARGETPFVSDRWRWGVRGGSGARRHDDGGF